jgi:hypothetical protein
VLPPALVGRKPGSTDPLKRRERPTLIGAGFRFGSIVSGDLVSAGTDAFLGSAQTEALVSPLQMLAEEQT